MLSPRKSIESLTTNEYEMLTYGSLAELHTIVFIRKESQMSCYNFKKILALTSNRLRHVGRQYNCSVLRIVASN